MTERSEQAHARLDKIIDLVQRLQTQPDEFWDDIDWPHTPAIATAFHALSGITSMTDAELAEHAGHRAALDIELAKLEADRG